MHGTDIRCDESTFKCIVVDMAKAFDTGNVKSE